MSKSKGLSPEQHLEVGSLLKEARNNLLIAANKTRCYRRLSDQLLAITDSFMSQRAWLERTLIDDVGADATVEGTHVRDVYFGSMEDVDA
jgi:hypothetical protein